MPNDGTAAIEQILTASDPWQALGLAPACVDEAAVKTACRQLSLKVHPDKNPEQRERATRAFQMLQDFRDAVTQALDWADRGMPCPEAAWTKAARSGQSKSDSEASAREYCTGQWPETASQWQRAWFHASQVWTPDYSKARAEWWRLMGRHRMRQQAGASSDQRRADSSAAALREAQLTTADAQRQGTKRKATWSG